MTVTALLPMKGHSERVPNKNMRLFAGKPLYHSVASILQRSDFIERIIINTDSPEIAEDASRHFSKVKIVWRPEELRGDFVPMNDIIAHDLSVSNSEHYLQTHSTNPLLTMGTLNTGIRKYFASLDRYDSLFSVTKMQTRLYWQDGQPVNHNPQELIRTQDLPPVYEENSNFFIFSKQAFAAAGNKRIGLTPLMFTMDKLEAIDIDEEVDFMLAQTLYQLKSQEEQA
jgi:CMP-N-acetylneuraminic acid synthetase